MLRAEGHVDERTPLRSLRLPDQRHVSLMREAISFSGITADARTDNVLPSGQAATIPRKHVIEIEVRAFKDIAAVLAGVFVPLEDVVPGKFYFFLRQPIKEKEDDDPRHPDLPRNGGHYFMIGRARGKIAPALEIVSEEIVSGIGRNDLSVALIEEGKGATGRANIDGLPKAVQHQHLTV